MLEIEKAIRAAVPHARSRRVVVAALYDLGEALCRNLAAEGVICGYVARTAPASRDPDPLIAGWWTDPSEGLWYLRYAAARSVILLGADADCEPDGRLLIEARRKGVQHILATASDGSVLRSVDVDAAPIRQPRAIQTRGPVSDFSYERGFREIFAGLGRRFRLPAESFDSNRILHMLGHLGPGGAERQAAYTAAGLARQYGYDVYVGCNHLTPPADFFRPPIEAAGAKVCKVADRSTEYDEIAIAELRNRLAQHDLGFHHILHAIFHYALLIQSIRPAIVHTWMDYCNVLAGIAAELVGVPTLVLSGRSVAPDNFPNLHQPYMRPGYLSLLGRRGVRFLNNSRAGAEDYARWLDLPVDNFLVNHNGFEFPTETPAAARSTMRRRYGIPDDAVVVGSITRFSEEKRPKLFVDMARILHDRHPEVRFLVFGGGTMLEDVRAYVEAGGLSNAVKLPGVVKDSWSALAAMDIFALTSRKEGLPNVLVEAQASGLPVVCTGVGGMEETFVQEETGLSVRAASAEALADAVSKLIGNPELRRRMSEKAFRHARDAFGVDKMLIRTLEAYNG